MNLRILPLLAILTCLPLLASAADFPTVTLKKGAPACATQDLLKQFLDAILKDDQATGEGLLKAGCIILDKDIQGTLRDFSSDGSIVMVRTSTDPSLDMWVPSKYMNQ